MMRLNMKTVHLINFSFLTLAAFTLFRFLIIRFDNERVNSMEVSRFIHEANIAIDSRNIEKTFELFSKDFRSRVDPSGLAEIVDRGTMDQLKKIDPMKSEIRTSTAKLYTHEFSGMYYTIDLVKEGGSWKLVDTPDFAGGPD
jgi:hypothetical protein